MFFAVKSAIIYKILHIFADKDSFDMLSIFTEFTINQLPLWAVLLVCAGVFLASLMDAIAGGGGIISVPTYLIWARPLW